MFSVAANRHSIRFADQEGLTAAHRCSVSSSAIGSVGLIVEPQLWSCLRSSVLRIPLQVASHGYLSGCALEHGATAGGLVLCVDSSSDVY